MHQPIVKWLKSGWPNVRTTVKRRTISVRIRKIVRNVIYVLRKMAAAIICNVLVVSMTSAGCAWAIGNHTDPNTMSAHAIEKIQISPTNRYTLRHAKRSKNIYIITNGGRIIRNRCSWNNKHWIVSNRASMRRWWKAWALGSIGNTYLHRLHCLPNAGIHYNTHIHMHISWSRDHANHYSNINR